MPSAVFPITVVTRPFHVLTLVLKADQVSKGADADRLSVGLLFNPVHSERSWASNFKNSRLVSSQKPMNVTFWKEVPSVLLVHPPLATSIGYINPLPIFPTHVDTARKNENVFISIMPVCRE